MRVALPILAFLTLALVACGTDDGAVGAPAQEAAATSGERHVATPDELASLLREERGLVVVDFYADWCGPCKMLAPELAKIAGAHPELTVVKVDVDEASELAAQYEVSSIPLLVAFRDGKAVARSVGYRDAAELEDWLGLRD